MVCTSGALPRGVIALHFSSVIFPFLISIVSALAFEMRVAPSFNAPGIVVTKVDCFALTGQPVPQYPKLRHPVTFLLIFPQLTPSFSQPVSSALLLALGGTFQS